MKLKNVFSTAVLYDYEELIPGAVGTESAKQRPLEDRDSYGRAFLQVMNLWRTNNESAPRIVVGKNGKGRDDGAIRDLP
ncbi:MAG: hypothetical protein IH951_01790 [Bacteroidetes bacterium]|nr:hypothetical protein [Bacteroidota bacterium]